MHSNFQEFAHLYCKRNIHMIEHCQMGAINVRNLHEKFIWIQHVFHATTNWDNVTMNQEVLPKKINK